MKNLKTNSSLSPSLNENPGAVPLSDTVQGLRAGSFKVKDTFYFSHDYNARSDEKIKRLIRKHGLLGYGIFWAIIEDLYNNANALHTDYEGIAFDLHTDSDIIKSVINDFDLFVVNNGEFGSLSVEKRLDARNEKSEKARESAFKRWNKDKEDANAMRTHSEGNAKKERKGKENKGNDIKEKENTIGDKSPAFKKCIAIYFDFYEKKTGLKPAFSAADGKHLKELISKLKKSIEQKNGPATDEKTENAFRVLLEKLPKFYQDKIDIKIINSKYDGIIAEIYTKNGAGQAQAWADTVDEYLKR